MQLRVGATHLADARVTNEKQLEKIVVFAGMHDEVVEAGFKGRGGRCGEAADEGGGGGRRVSMGRWL